MSPRSLKLVCMSRTYTYLSDADPKRPGRMYMILGLRCPRSFLLSLLILQASHILHVADEPCFESWCAYDEGPTCRRCIKQEPTNSLIWDTCTSMQQFCFTYPQTPLRIWVTCRMLNWIHFSVQSRHTIADVAFIVECAILWCLVRI